VGILAALALIAMTLYAFNGTIDPLAFATILIVIYAYRSTE